VGVGIAPVVAKLLISNILSYTEIAHKVERHGFSFQHEVVRSGAKWREVWVILGVLATPSGQFRL